MIVKGNKIYGVETKIVGGSTPTLQDKTITNNGQYTADSGYDGLGTVTANVQPNLTALNATQNGTYTPTSPVQGYNSVTVNVQGGGGGDSYIEAWFIVDDKLLHIETDWGINTKIANDVTNVTAMYFDGRSYPPARATQNWNWTFGTHRVKFVFDPDHNEIPANMFNTEATFLPVYIDFSHFTGVCDSPILSHWADTNAYVYPNTEYVGQCTGGSTRAIIQRNTNILDGMDININGVYIESSSLSNFKNNYSGNVVYEPQNENNLIQGIYLPEDYRSIMVSNYQYNNTPVTVDEYNCADYFGAGIAYMPKYMDKCQLGKRGGNFVFRNPVPPQDLGGSPWGEFCAVWVPSAGYSDYVSAFGGSGSVSVHNISIIDVTLIGWDTTYNHLLLGKFYSNEGVELYDANGDTVLEFVGYGDRYLLPRWYAGSNSYSEKIYTRWTDWDYTTLGDMFMSANVVTVDMTDCYGTALNQTFYDCNQLQTIVLPETITDLGSDFCYNCPVLQSVTILANSVPNIDPDTAFRWDERHTQPSPVPTVYVTSASDYLADSNWSALVNDGYITIEDIT